MLNVQQSSTEVTFDSMSGFLAFIHFLCSFSNLSEALLLLFPSFSQQLEGFLSNFTRQQRWRHLYNKNMCKESRAICSATTLWHWYHITRCKHCAPKQRACHAATPGNVSELLLIYLVPCCKSYRNLQSSLCNTIRIQGSKRQEGMGEIAFLQVFEKNFLCHRGFSTLSYIGQSSFLSRA